MERLVSHRGTGDGGGGYGFVLWFGAAVAVWMADLVGSAANGLVRSRQRAETGCRNSRAGLQGGVGLFGETR